MPCLLDRNRVVENYCIIASSALLFADTLMTLTSEVQRIWRRKFTGATAVFLVTRCVPVLRLDDALTDISYLMFGVFLMLRVRGIWGKGWVPLALLTVLTPLRPILSIYNQVHYTPIAFGAPLGGCGADIDNAIYAQKFLHEDSWLALDATVLVLTWLRTLGVHRESRRLGLHTPLVTLLLRDGTLYFLIIMVIQICGIVSMSAGNVFALWEVWPFFDQVFTVIFSCRFMLDLRGVYLAYAVPSHPDFDGGKDTLASGHAELSRLRFSTSVVGNMGAPLDTFGVGSKSHARSFSCGSGWSRETEETEADTFETSEDPLFADLHHPVDIEHPETPSRSVP
ncbi:hypothetical protein VTO73DRAFT_10601 [Trametes versicolor]